MEDAVPARGSTLPPKLAVADLEDPRQAVVQRVLQSPLFLKAPALSRFLQYVCAQVFSGNSAQINEQLIGIEVFGRKPGYDSNDDNIVRATASRLRSRLDAYFAQEGADEEWCISLPRGSYVPQFTRRSARASELESSPDSLADAPAELPSSLVFALTTNNLLPSVGPALPDPPQPQPTTLPAVHAAAPDHQSVRHRWRSAPVRLAALLLVGSALIALGFSWRAIEDRRHASAPSSAHHVPNKQARDLYIEGRYLWARHEPDPIHESILRFQQAIRLDPDYALPYSGLADAYAVSASGLPAAERWIEAQSYAQQALALDPNSSEAHTSLAFILYKFEWNWPAAEQHFRRAVQLDPGYALAHHWFGEFLVLRLRADEGLAQLRQAVALAPLSLPIRNDLARALYRTRHYNEAIAEARHVIELDPSFNAYAVLTYAYEQKHDYEQAVSADLQFARMSGVSPAQIALLRHTFERSGWQAYWAAKLDLLKQAPPGSVAAYVFAEDSLRAGNRDAAIHYLYQSFDDRGDAPLLIGTEPLLDPLRSDPRFQYLMRRAGL